MNKERKLEAEILASFERGEWQPAPNGKNPIARFSEIASTFLTKIQPDKIRTSSIHALGFRKRRK